MAKYKHILITVITLIIPVIVSALSSVSATALNTHNLNWQNETTISGTIAAGIGDSNRSVSFTGTPPKLVGRIEFNTGQESNANAPQSCSVVLELSMTSASSGNISPVGENCGGDDIIGQATIGSVDRAPDNVNWATDDGSGESADDETTTCSIDGVGWLICPIVVFIGSITDGLYGQLEKLFLLTEPLSTKTDSPMYTIWAQIRNVANIAFILAFLVVVLSHVSSIGLSNYNIKKMLPRIIIAAILVNVSYWICAIAIDISNIIGANSQSIFTESLSVDMDSDGPWKSGSWWSEFIVMILAIGTMTMVHVSILLPVLISALAALVVVVAVLLLREALIILLVVISPLAFVAFLLPNTEDLFTKWRKLFTTLLLMYPVIGAIFGASQLASQIVMAGSDDILVQIAGAGISVIPLFITPVVMKTAGGVLNRFGGIVNNRDKGVFDRMRNSASDYRGRKIDNLNLKGLKRREAGRPSLRGGFIRRRAKNDEEKRSLERGISKAKASYVAQEVSENEDYRNKVAGGSNFQRAIGKVIGDDTLGRADQASLTGVQASAISTLDSLQADEVKAATALIAEANMPPDALQKLAMGQGDVTHGGFTFTANDNITRTAAIDTFLKSANVKQAEELVDVSGAMSEGQRQHLTAGLTKYGLVSKAVHLSGQTLGDIEQGKIVSAVNGPTASQQQAIDRGEQLESLDSVTMRAADGGKFSAQTIATSHPATLERLSRVMPSVNPATQEEVRSKIEEAVTNTSTAGLIQTSQEKILSNIYGKSLTELRKTAPDTSQSDNQQPQNKPVVSQQAANPNDTTTNSQSQSSGSQVNARTPQTQSPANPMQPGELKINHDTPIAQPQTINQATSSSYNNYATNTSNVTNSNYMPANMREAKVRETVERVGEPAGSNQFKQTSEGLFVPPSYTPQSAPATQPVQVIKQTQPTQPAQPSPPKPTPPSFQSTPSQAATAPHTPVSDRSPVNPINETPPPFTGDDSQY